MKRLLVLAATVIALAGFTAAPAAAQTRDDITVIIEPTDATVVLGESLDLTITVTNTGTAALPASVVHIDITDPGESTSVDPEDWTPTLSKRIGELAPGATTTVDWTIQPISPGTFSTYAVVLSADRPSVVASQILRVAVSDQRTLNPGGILPVAIGAPVLVGGLLAWQRLSTRRSALRPV